MLHANHGIVSKKKQHFAFSNQTVGDRPNANDADVLLGNYNGWSFENSNAIDGKGQAAQCKGRVCNRVAGLPMNGLSDRHSGREISILDNTLKKKV